MGIFALCQHAQYGNVRVLGRIWGSDAVAGFNGNVASGKIVKGSDVRLEGNIQQYNGKNEIIKTTFNFYRCEPMALKEYKAAFRLTGEVVSFGDDAAEVEGFRPLRVRILQEKKEDFEGKEEVFEVYVPRIVLLEMPTDPAPGQTVRLKGYIENPEDEFGDATGKQLPVVRKLEIFTT